MSNAPAARGEEQTPAHDEGQPAHRGHEDPRMLLAQEAARAAPEFRLTIPRAPLAVRYVSKALGPTTLPFDKLECRVKLKYD